MQLHCNIAKQNYEVDLAQPISLALGFGPGLENPNAFHIPPAIIEPIRVGGFVGSVLEGGSANCEMVTYCAHGNGTHTEGVGHLSKERIPVHTVLQKFWFTAQLITVDLVLVGRSWVIDKSQLINLNLHPTEAIIIRTKPNNEAKKSNVWSGKNPPFFTVEAMQFLVDFGFEHLLTDLPSVDPEEDAGALAAHRIWWKFPKDTRKYSSITELIYVSNSIPNGLYALNLMVPKIDSDAVPSQPIIYPLKANL